MSVVADLAERWGFARCAAARAAVPDLPLGIPFTLPKPMIESASPPSRTHPRKSRARRRCRKKSSSMTMKLFMVRPSAAARRRVAISAS